MRRLAWLLPPLCLALGVIIGRSLPTNADPSAPQAPPRHLRVGPLTCVNVREAQAEQDDQARLAACQARLAEATGPKPTFVEPWPQRAGPEAPEVWTAAMERVFATCGLGLDLEAVDCEEYPCTAALRGDAGGLDERALGEKLEGCPAWTAYTEGMGSPSATFQPMDLRCPDGTYQSAWVFVAMDDEGEAMDEVARDMDLVSLLMTFGRRTNAVARQWRCD